MAGEAPSVGSEWQNPMKTLVVLMTFFILAIKAAVRRD